MLLILNPRDKTGRYFSKKYLARAALLPANPSQPDRSVSGKIVAVKLAAATSFVFAIAVLAGGVADAIHHGSLLGAIVAAPISGVLLILSRAIAAGKLPAMYAASGIAMAASVIYAAKMVALESLLAASMMVLSFCALFLILLGFFLRLKEMEE
jgi:hypothetical protein